MIANIDFHNLAAQKYWAPPASWSLEKKKETTINRIFSEDWMGARKIDGAFYKFIKNNDGSTELLGRSKSVSGDYLNKIEWVPQLRPLFDALPAGTCLLGELYFPGREGSSNVTTIMGCLVDKAIARQTKGDKLHYYIFDVLAYANSSFLRETAQFRFDVLKNISKKFNCDCVEWAQYYDGEELWQQLQNILASGGEGMVITRKQSLYQPDKRPSKDCQKVKKELQETIDCFFTGYAMPPTREYTGKEIVTWKYWLDEVTGERKEGELYNEYFKGAPLTPITKPYFYGWAGSLEIGVIKDNKVVPIGFLSNLTEEIKANYKEYKGRVIEVTAMEKLPTGGLRHAKMLNFRDDLTIKDCSWEKYMGEDK